MGKDCFFMCFFIVKMDVLRIKNNILQSLNIERTKFYRGVFHTY